VKEPVWILPRAVGAIHKRQIAEHGGEPGIRDENLLESALARPRNLFAYGKHGNDLPTLAAAYAFGIAKNHAFNDGNKRTAMVVALTFLKLNGLDLVASPDEKYEKFEGLASGRVTERALAKWLQASCRPTGSPTRA
jgi:death on curing protein